MSACGDHQANLSHSPFSNSVPSRAWRRHRDGRERENKKDTPAGALPVRVLLSSSLRLAQHLPTTQTRPGSGLQKPGRGPGHSRPMSHIQIGRVALLPWLTRHTRRLAWRVAGTWDTTISRNQIKKLPGECEEISLLGFLADQSTTETGTKSNEFKAAFILAIGMR